MDKTVDSNENASDDGPNDNGETEPGITSIGELRRTILEGPLFSSQVDDPVNVRDENAGAAPNEKVSVSVFKCVSFDTKNAVFSLFVTGLRGDQSRF